MIQVIRTYNKFYGSVSSYLKMDNVILASAYRKIKKKANGPAYFTDVSTITLHVVDIPTNLLTQLEEMWPVFMAEVADLNALTDDALFKIMGRE